MLLKFLLVFALMNPLWPFGQNPVPGAPYVIVNKLTNELAYINHGKVIQVYSVATGATPSLTPEGEYMITVKAKNPYFRRKNIPGGAEDNPLGTRWIGINVEGTDGRIYGIHGNNDETSIGKYVTNGCIRMKNEEVESLYNQLPIGTKVLIVSSDQDFSMIGKENGALY